MNERKKKIYREIHQLKPQKKGKNKSQKKNYLIYTKRYGSNKIKTFKQNTLLIVQTEKMQLL